MLEDSCFSKQEWNTVVFIQKIIALWHKINFKCIYTDLCLYVLLVMNDLVLNYLSKTENLSLKTVHCILKRSILARKDHFLKSATKKRRGRKEKEKKGKKLF